MLCRTVGVLLVGGVISMGMEAQTATADLASSKVEDTYWIAYSDHPIAHRSTPGGDERPFKGHYNPLRPSEEVYCTMVTPSAPAPKGSSAASKRGVHSEIPCELRYQTADGDAQLAQVPPNRWVPLSSLKDIPPPPQLVKSSRVLLEEMGRRAQRAGLSKGSGCAGDLPVLAPACRDTVDLNDFIVEWLDPPGGGMYASLFLDTIDEFQPQSIRLDRIPLQAHRYEDPRIKRFFEDVQKDSAPTNVVLRISQSQGVEATRILTIPSRIEQRGFHEQLEMVEAGQALFRNIALLSVYVNFGLWSKAGKQARELLALAPDEELVKTYALIGFCQSGYSRETEELRTSLKRLGITDICTAGQK